jgi:hypothetical protein
MAWLRCLRCETRHEIGPLFQGCPRCAAAGALGLLDPEYGDEATTCVTLASLTAGAGSIWSAAPRLPLGDPRHIVSLGEGRTPLVRVPRLAREVGCENLFLKLETMNPTWSHKDRYNSVVVSMARSLDPARLTTPRETTATPWRRTRPPPSSRARVPASRGLGGPAQPGPRLRRGGRRGRQERGGRHDGAHDPRARLGAVRLVQLRRGRAHRAP